ncbi:fungal trichothecene efflux pump [Annulohypoxylon maeteangense]|uniref:fungal trichothecene efflux pump n=1 Tax=Annulohypoxylon maeteangense TaxID=1927788 RepID=UPI0020084AE2|nr:fungal trichothecene efflux pump [Annulohypoxylon maeteangense]KAI0883703.1 fungal trichothecene efflux pump [Annulohypoxylon maeteangense]
MSDIAGSTIAHTRTKEDGDQLRSEALAADSKQLPAGYYSSTRVIGTFGGIGFSLLGTYWAFSVGAAVITAINRDIGPSANASLFSIVWTVCDCISILLFGRLSDRFGRRWLAIGANLLGIVGGIVACTAKNMDVLIGANVLLGLASGPPASYPLLTGELATNKTKYLATVLVVIPNVIATGFGAYLGQRIVLQTTWRWIFIIYIIFMIPGTILFYFFYFPPSFTQMHGKESKTIDEIKKIDFLGVFLLVAGLALFLLGVSWGGQPLAWDSATILGLLISGFVCLVAFILYEIFGGAERPIIPMHFFKDLTGFTPIVVISAVTGCLNVALQITWPSQVTRVFGNSDWETTAWLTTTVAFGAWAGIVFVGSLFHIIKHIRWQLIIGCAWMSAFIGAMASIQTDQQGRAAAFSFLATIPVGWGEVVTMLMVQYVASDMDLGVAFAVVSAMRSVVGSIFTAVFTAEIANKLPEKLTSIVVPAVTAAGLPSSSVTALLSAVSVGTEDALRAVPGMNDDILTVASQSIAQAYAGAYTYPYYTGLALGLVSLIAALCIRDFDSHLTDHVSRQLYHKSDTDKDVLSLVDRSPTQDGEAVTETKQITKTSEGEA